MTFRLPVVSLLLIFSLCACSGNDEVASKEQARQVGEAPREIHLPGGDWGLPTPFAFYPRGPGYIHLSLVYDTLVWKDRNGTIPWLAERWENSPDGLTWTFHLRPDVKWQDGQPLTSRDVCFTFGYLRQHPVEWFVLGRIARVEAKDDRTVLFHLRSPYAPFLTRVAGSIPIIPEHIWKDIPDPRTASNSKVVMGSGPYRLLHYDKAQGAYAYEANPDFFLGAPQTQKIFFVPIGDPVAALDRGLVDEANIPASLLSQFNNREDFAILSGPSYWVLTLRFNSNLLPFSKPEVRRAVAYAIDRKALIEQGVPGGLRGAKPGSPGFLPPDSDWFDPSLQDLYPHDAAKAVALLRSVGIEDRDGDRVCEGPDGTPMRFTLLTTASYLREAELIRLMLGEIGIAAQPKVQDIKSMDALVREGNFALALTGHGGLGADPSIIMGFGAVEEDPHSLGAPTDPAYLAAAQKLLEESDPAARMSLCRTMQRLYSQELPALPLYYPISFVAYRPKVFDGWFYTAQGGIGIGVPMLYNKLAFVRGARP